MLNLKLTEAQRIKVEALRAKVKANSAEMIRLAELDAAEMMANAKVTHNVSAEEALELLDSIR